ncbi:MAG: HisA/HisF-related TIM barrel protein [Candidatus Hodgkinia cicadicola]
MSLEFMFNCVNKFGSHRNVTSVDCEPSNGSREVFTHGGLRAMGINAFSYICEMESHGVGELILTSLDRAGTQTASTCYYSD